MIQNFDYWVNVLSLIATFYSGTKQETGVYIKHIVSRARLIPYSDKLIRDIHDVVLAASMERLY